jgi:hypothetical protein
VLAVGRKEAKENVDDRKVERVPKRVKSLYG